MAVKIDSSIVPCSIAKAEKQLADERSLDSIIKNKLIERFCEKGEIEDTMSLKKIMLFMIYVKKKSKRKMLKYVDNIQNFIKENDSNWSYYSYEIEHDLKEISKLLSYLPDKNMFKLQYLLPGLTDSEIDSVYKMSLPRKSSIDKISNIIEQITEIVHIWNKDAKVCAYGSLVNGFLLNNSSDLDLTILLPDKIHIHPLFYYSDLIHLLINKTDCKWNCIKTDKLFILNCDDFQDMNVEILFNNITGMTNCEYIRTFAEIDYRFHKLGYYIKYFVKKSNMFTKQNKLNSFSLLCMLIVYLQDKVQPPVLPRIIYKKGEFNQTELKSPAYVDKYGRTECKINKLKVCFQSDSKEIINEQVKQAKKTNGLSVNKQTCAELFRGFIHYYFNGGGFDHIHDVVDTRSGVIRNLNDIPSKLDDNTNGIEAKIRKGLADCAFAVLDPFDFSYCPSRGFSIDGRKEQIFKLQSYEMQYVYSLLSVGMFLEPLKE